jgi:hypothetical protein
MKSLLMLLFIAVITAGCTDSDSEHTYNVSPESVEIRYIILDPTLVGKCMIDKSWIKKKDYQTAPFIKITGILKEGYGVTIIRSEHLYPSEKLVRVIVDYGIYNDLSDYTERTCPKE